jgi:hypothetical protein
LTSRSSPYAPLILEKFIRACSKDIAVLITVRDGNTRSILSKIHRVLSQAGWRYVILKLILFSNIRLQQLFGRYPTLSRICREHFIKQVELSSIKSEESLQVVREHRPDFLISILFEQIIPQELIEVPTIAALNLHPAPLPRYAGVAPVFWVLSKNESATGVAIHHLKKELDAGDIVLQQSIQVDIQSSVHGLYVKCC